MKRLMSNSPQLAKGRLVSGRPMFFSCSRCTSNRISEGMICQGADAPERDEPLRGRVSIAVSRPWEARVVSVIIAYRGLWRNPNGTAATDPKSAIALCVGKTLKEIGGNWWTVNETETKTGVMLDCYLTTTALTILKPTREKGSVFALPSDPSKAFPDHRLLKYVKRQHEIFAWPLGNQETSAAHSLLWQKGLATMTRSSTGPKPARTVQSFAFTTTNGATTMNYDNFF